MERNICLPDKRQRGHIFLQGVAFTWAVFGKGLGDLLCPEDEVTVQEQARGESGATYPTTCSPPRS